jgi:hypothetical protein
MMRQEYKERTQAATAVTKYRKPNMDKIKSKFKNLDPFLSRGYEAPQGLGITSP